MPQDSFVIFVCEHGAAKSVIAAAYFNKLTAETGSQLRAVARGTNPDNEFSPNTIAGLREDGLMPTENVPQKLALSEVESAQRIVSFCELPEEFHENAVVEHWENIPPVSENYVLARDAILERLHKLIKMLR